MTKAILGLALLIAALMGGFFVGALGALTDEEWPEW
jgi:hypothetical protein